MKVYGTSDAVPHGGWLSMSEIDDYWHPVASTNVDYVDKFVSLFRGRGDVYGSAKGYCVKAALTRDVFARHLMSLDPNDWIGVYCMISEQCSWGCIDIDGKDFPYDGTFHDRWDWDAMRDLADALVAVLKVKGILAHIERTKNGYHVWVFPEEALIPARIMRRALMAACKAIDYDPKEVNPKAEGPRPGTKGYGNFVRLPYGGHLATLPGLDPRPSPRTFVGADDEQLSLTYVLDVIPAVGRTPLAKLEPVAALWTPPPEPSVEIRYEEGLEVEPILPLLDGRSYTIWKEGPLPGSDRSTTLARLAHLLAERGLTATQAWAVVDSADKRWGKFNDQGRPEQLERMIEGAYG